MAWNKEVVMMNGQLSEQMVRDRHERLTRQAADHRRLIGRTRRRWSKPDDGPRRGR